jgi:hypothetical protein
VFDAEKNGNHQFIGSWQGSLQALQDAANQAQGLPLVNPKKKAGRADYVSSGGRLLPLAAAGRLLMLLPGRTGSPGSHRNCTSPNPGLPWGHPLTRGV